MPSDTVLKRPSSSLSSYSQQPNSKRVKRSYHRQHRLQKPVAPALPERAITDNASVDELMNRLVAQSLHEAGYDMAQPVALETIRGAAEEYIMRLASHVRQSMLACRRIQPIPQDFENGLKRHHLRVDDLHPYLNINSPTPEPPIHPSQPEEEHPLRNLPFLGPQLSGQEDRTRCPYIPTHFPQFPSQHTYRHTPVLTEREQDPRRIRERATEDGRHGEDALRKLARAAFKDDQLRSVGQDKKPWGRRTETMDSMFEETVKELAGKMPMQTAAVPGSGSSLVIDSGQGTDSEMKEAGLAGPMKIELPPIVNCEKDYWRRSVRADHREREEPSNAKGESIPPPGSF